MITATIRDNGFRVEGHANMAPRGQDIVCASVSALVGAIIGTLKGNVVEQNDGVVDCIIDDSPLLYGCLCMLYVGLVNIEQQYPKYVKVVIDS